MDKPPQVPNKRVVFIVGCARSGTTWLQLLLAQHPAVATSQETHLFSKYLGPMQSQWASDESLKVPIGLPTLMSRDEFLAACREYAENVLGRVIATKEGAFVALEKTPDHVSHAPFILDVFPGAHVIHLVRDPRAVVASLMAASDKYDWATRSPVQCTHQWLRAVRHGQDIANLTDRFTEVTYEDLHRRPVEELGRLLRWLELEIEPGFCDRAVSACSLDGMKRRPGEVLAPESIKRDMGNVYRKGRTDSWRDELSDSEIHVVEHLASEAMSRYGYEYASRRPTRRPTRVTVYSFLDRFQQALRWRINRTLSRL